MGALRSVAATPPPKALNFSGKAPPARTDYARSLRWTVEQPVPFSHEHHVAGLGIDCRMCHASVEVGPGPRRARASQRRGRSLAATAGGVRPRRRPRLAHARHRPRGNDVGFGHRHRLGEAIASRARSGAALEPAVRVLGRLLVLWQGLALRYFEDGPLRSPPVVNPSPYDGK